MNLDPAQLDALGKKAFSAKKFIEAAEYFKQAAEAYTLAQNEVAAAESKNNLSVALLQIGKAQEALEAAQTTDILFASANDIKRQAMALGNQAAALEALHRYPDALEKYEHSAELFASIQEGDLRAMVMKSAAAIKLKTGNLTESAFKMIGSLDAKKTPTLFERVMKFFMRFIK